MSCRFAALESEISKERSEHLRFREPHCHSAPLSIPLRIFAQTLYFYKLESLTYILSVSQNVGIGQSSFKFFWLSSKVIDFGKRLCNFLLVHHINLGHILHRFRDIAGICAHDPNLIPL